MTTIPATVATTTEPGSLRGKKIVGRILLILFCLSMALAVVTIWTRNQITDTDRYVRTVSPLASNPAIQNGVAERVTNSLTELLDTRAATEGTLLNNQRWLAAPLSRAVNTYVGEAVRNFLASEQFETFWVEANRRVHEQVNAIIAGGERDFISTENGQVSLDLTPLLSQVNDRLVAQGIDIMDETKLAEGSANIVLFESQALERAQRIVHLLETLAIVFPVIALLALGGSIILSSDRRQTIIWSGLGLAIAMVALLVFLAIGRWLYLDNLGPDVNRAAAESFFDTLLRYLRDALRLFALVGFLVAGIAFITRPESRFKQALAAAGSWIADTWKGLFIRWPWLATSILWLDHRRKLLWGALIVICSLIIILSDTPTLRTVGVAFVTAMIGLALMTIIDEIADRIRSGTLSPARVLSTESAEPPVAVSTGATVAAEAPPTSPQAALLDIASQLSAEDLTVLRRLGSLLRDTGGSGITPDPVQPSPGSTL